MDTIKMACHTWALSGNPNMASQVNEEYVREMDAIGARYDYGENLQGATLKDVRNETMELLQTLCEPRTELPQNEVFLCGGFRDGQVCPEHMWLEDHTGGKSYDTFIDQPVKVVDQVSVPGQPFKPACEGDAFLADEIFRVQVNGYTSGQFDSIP